MQCPIASGARHSFRAGHAQTSHGPSVHVSLHEVAPVHAELLSEPEEVVVVEMVDELPGVDPASPVRVDAVEEPERAELPVLDEPPWPLVPPETDDVLALVFPVDLPPRVDSEVPPASAAPSCTRPPQPQAKDADAKTSTVNVDKLARMKPPPTIVLPRASPSNPNRQARIPGAT